MAAGRFVPTALTASRLVLAVFVVMAILRGAHNEALALLAAAGTTDFFDGYLARRFHWETRLGAWLDGIADKALLSAVFVALALSGAAPVWLVWLVLGRDVFILLMAAAALLFTAIRDFPPSVWGKLSTNVQIVTALAILGPFRTPQVLLVPLCAGVTAWSGLHYFHRALRRLRVAPAQPD